MEKYAYIKKIPKYKSYRSQSRVTKVLHAMRPHKKFGILIILVGALFVGLAEFSTFQDLFHTNAQSSSIINPIPLASLADDIQKTNVSADTKSPLQNYIPTNQSMPLDESYATPFSISFPSLDLKNIKITPNVDATNAALYESILSGSAAHFKGTPLPGEGGNSFIYAHSSVTWFNKLYPYSYEGVFTALFYIHIGDSISIHIKGKDLIYIVEGISTINVNDFSQVQDIRGINTLTLMTCSPPGVDDKRLIVKAIQI